MNNRYLPSLIIFAKGMLVIAIGLFFKFTDKPESNMVLGIGGGIIAVSLLVLIIMHLTKPKNR